MPEEQIASAMGERVPREDTEFEVWAENAESLRIFVELRTQWSVAAGALQMRRIGLRYEAAETVMRLRRVKDRGAVFDDLRVMEDAALETWYPNVDG